MDVARRAGVSRSTVSYVLNGVTNQKIPASTRARVLQAAADLGYAPSLAAQALRRGTSRSILLVLPDAPIGEALAHFIDRVADAVEAHGYTVVFRRRRADRTLLSLWRELAPAAIVVDDEVPEADVAAVERTGTPVLAAVTDNPGATPRFSQPVIGRMQVAHLASRGHRVLAYAGSADPRLSRFQDGRLAGVRAACRDQGLPPPRLDVVAFDAEAVTGAVRRWRSRARPVTAVCAYNDEIALAVLVGARRLGLAVPGDLAVVGVDNTSLSALAEPPLTTVQVNSDRIADGAAHAVLARLLPPGERPPAPEGESVELVVRAST
jgi:DNA-binding LacI/PurR family transcriptional regulator